MSDFQNLIMGLGVAFQSYNLLMAVIGLVLGIIVGVLGISILASLLVKGERGKAKG